MKKRIIGIDVARALAIIGMIIVNFKIVFGDTGAQWLRSFAAIFEGKAAATFVVLAGVGIALLSNSAIRDNNIDKIKLSKKRILKRAIFLFVVGLSYIFIWPADILHFYGVYMLIALVLLEANHKLILAVALGMIFLYPVLMILWGYETGWNADFIEYLDFWTVNGFIRNLFYNGFHPVFPWAAFMLVGVWFGKQNLYEEAFIKRAAGISLGIFIFMQLVSYTSISLLSGGNPEAAKEFAIILGSSPMPPLPIYMISGSSIAICIICSCILLANRFESNKLIIILTQTGQLALTFYIAHVVIGMLAVEIVSPGSFGSYSIEFSIGYALVFSLACITFAGIWMRHKRSGPLEWVMRKVTE